MVDLEGCGAYRCCKTIGGAKAESSNCQSLGIRKLEFIILDEPLVGYRSKSQKFLVEIVRQTMS